MNKFIIDASVILGYLLQKNEKIVNRVESLLKKFKKGEIEIYAPQLLFTEVANGLRFSLKDENLAASQFEKYAKLKIDYPPFSEIQMKEIIKLSYKLGTTVYDTSYHFLAIMLNGTFLTCDKEYFVKAKQLEKIELVD
ncbi:MAG: type II toxin-antitoxin system VapC family toxin [bacterium]|nr:type II toxin-antitoxin system VapC family toxin [bacterium]